MRSQAARGSLTAPLRNLGDIGEDPGEARPKARPKELSKEVRHRASYLAVSRALVRFRVVPRGRREITAEQTPILLFIPYLGRIRCCSDSR